MKIRGLSLLVVVLALVVIGAWLWFAREVPPPASFTDSRPAPAPQSTERPADPVPPAGPASATAPAPASAPAEPVRMSSAVAPGMPAVRTVATPTPRPVAISGPTSLQPAARFDPQADAKADLEGVRFMFRDFRTRMGENPVGSNAEIMRAVMGGNEAKARLGPPPGQSLNAQGELVDRWGTPYFFHQLSATSIEIRSAGPDGKLWTADDLVEK